MHIDQPIDRYVDTSIATGMCIYIFMCIKLSISTLLAHVFVSGYMCLKTFVHQRLKTMKPYNNYLCYL